MAGVGRRLQYFVVMIIGIVIRMIIAFCSCNVLRLCLFLLFWWLLSFTFVNSDYCEYSEDYCHGNNDDDVIALCNAQMHTSFNLMNMTMNIREAVEQEKR